MNHSVIPVDRVSQWPDCRHCVNECYFVVITATWSGHVDERDVLREYRMANRFALMPRRQSLVFAHLIVTFV